jgi:F420H(2)-dependent quinone reductase
VTLEGPYEPSAFEAVQEQVRLYEATDGREGGELQGKPCVILWTRGRRTGAVRKSPLMRVRHGDQYAVIASFGGAPSHPVWYLNILGDAHVSLQDGAELLDYTARVVEGAERDEWWRRANEDWPAYDTYQARTERLIPVVVLDPAG